VLYIYHRADKYKYKKKMHFKKVVGRQNCGEKKKFKNKIKFAHSGGSNLRKKALKN
jgi:hypothetical protein